MLLWEVSKRVHVVIRLGERDTHKGTLVRFDMGALRHHELLRGRLSWKRPSASGTSAILIDLRALWVVMRRITSCSLFFSLVQLVEQTLSFGSLYKKIKRDHRS